MKKISLIKDDIYPKKEILKKRRTVRAILINKNKEIALLHIIGKDLFGYRNHYETPGGGIEDKEDEITSLKREIQEELGFSIKNIKVIDFIGVEYNLLQRIDEGYFYFCEVDFITKMKRTTYEQSIFSNIEWICFQDIDKFYKNQRVVNVGVLIHKRDYYMIKRAKELGYFD